MHGTPGTPKHDAQVADEVRTIREIDSESNRDCFQCLAKKQTQEARFPMFLEVRFVNCPVKFKTCLDLSYFVVTS